VPNFVFFDERPSDDVNILTHTRSNQGYPESMSTKVSKKKQFPVTPEMDCIKIGNDYYGARCLDTQL